MAESKNVMGNNGTQFQDEALFKALEAKKKKKKRRIVWTILLILALALVGGFFGVKSLRKKVDDTLKTDDSDVTSFAAKHGSVSTTVSGYGTLANVDEEKIEIPAGVDVVEVLVKENNIVEKGDTLATVEPASVLDAMMKLQESIAEIDEKLEEADNDSSTKYVYSGVSGRVKKIYAEVGETVADCMYDHAALALISLDGYMTCDVETESLSAGDAITVNYGDGISENGRVERVINGVASVILSDVRAPYGAAAEILTAGGEKVGEGVLRIHSPLRVTAVAGTVYSLNVKENDPVTSGSVILALSNTEYAAAFDYYMKQRKVMEEDLFTLNSLYRDGALLAPYSGTVTKIDYDKDAAKTTTTIINYADHSTASTVDKSKDPIPIVTLSPDVQVKTTISVDESNILLLELGQIADITISSIGEDVFEGTVTEINKTAAASSGNSNSTGSSGYGGMSSRNSGVTKYAAVVTMDKTSRMLAGMSANVVIRVQGVENALMIPVDALHQTSTTSFVYTSYDKETQEYGGLTEVETGISNSEYVEIISGLEEGTEVYYAPKKNDRDFMSYFF